ncbi:MAG: peptide deformylase [Parcubacteria group bacterium Athens0416_74]|nr:MAG: peptide deformylase [Parcubacteria group bacterium Athens0416_74]
MRIILPHGENPALRERSREIPLAEISSTRIQGLIAEMKSLLSKEEFGVALAACQVGEPVRLFIVSGRALLRQAQDKSPKHPRSEYDEPELPPVASEVEPDQVYINPELLKMSRGRTDKHEGCLSIRGKWGMVPRAAKATVRAYDENGTPFMRGASGFLAHIFQHEMDHLEGILYSDKATELYDDNPEDHA